MCKIGKQLQLGSRLIVMIIIGQRQDNNVNVNTKQGKFNIKVTKKTKIKLKQFYWMSVTLTQVVFRFFL